MSVADDFIFNLNMIASNKKTKKLDYFLMVIKTRKFELTNRRAILSQLTEIEKYIYFSQIRWQMANKVRCKTDKMSNLEDIPVVKAMAIRSKLFARLPLTEEQTELENKYRKINDNKTK